MYKHWKLVIKFFEADLLVIRILIETHIDTLQMYVPHCENFLMEEILINLRNPESLHRTMAKPFKCLCDRNPSYS